MTSTGNIVLDRMLKIDGCPLTAVVYVELAYMGDRTVADLEGEEIIDLWNFEKLVRNLGKPEPEDEE